MTDSRFLYLLFGWGMVILGLGIGIAGWFFMKLMIEMVEYPFGNGSGDIKELIYNEHSRPIECMSFEEFLKTQEKI